MIERLGIGAIVGEVERRDLATLSDYELLVSALGDVAAQNNRLGLEPFEMAGATLYPVGTGHGEVVSTPSAKLTEGNVTATRTAQPVTGYARYVAVWPGREAAVYDLSVAVQPEDTISTMPFGPIAIRALDKDKSLSPLPTRVGSTGEEGDKLYARRRTDDERRNLPNSVFGTRIPVVIDEDASLFIERTGIAYRAGDPTPGSVIVNKASTRPLPSGYTRVEGNRVHVTTNTEATLPVQLVGYPQIIRVPEPGIPGLANGAVREKDGMQVRITQTYDIGKPVVLDVPPTDDPVVHRLTAEALPWKEITTQIFEAHKDELAALAPEIDRGAVLVALREAIEARRADTSSPTEPIVVGVRDVIKWLGNQFGVNNSRTGVQLI